MVHLQRKIKCKWCGEEKYLPKDVPTDNWLPVIGYETRRRNARNPESGESIVVEDTYFKVINNNGKLVDIAAFNCKVTVDSEENATVSIAAAIGQIMAIIGEICPDGFLKVATHEIKYKQV